ncbi:MAG: LL-diaminopimelate aminotransferase [Muribaculaceae bacterium]
MIKINDNFGKLQESYLFSEIARKVRTFEHDNPDAHIIRMGIGDVTLPICEASIAAMHKAVDEMAHAATFHGYGPEQGYSFLAECIAQYDYAERGISIDTDEIFISDGAKSDTGNIGDILSVENMVAVTDPVYPVYVDSNVMAGRAGTFTQKGSWSNIQYMPCTAENGFIPALPAAIPDMIYLCYPNNPTGTTLNKAQLKKWVDFAIQHRSLILFDSAYEAFITEDDVPHSIYEIDGARRCAIEFRSFSKTAGFTGLRCGYTVIPKELLGYDSAGNPVQLNKLWNRRQCTKFNGASYITQRAAEAIYTPEGRSQVREAIGYYLRNAKVLREGLAATGLQAVGGINAPYVWVKTPAGMSSWDFFAKLLSECHIVGTPGVGFGPSGEGYFRLTAFNTYERTLEAVKRIKEFKL